MTTYEQRCRVLLKAFPDQYRTERGDEIVGVLLDTGRAEQRWPSLRTAADLVAGGLRVRARLTSQGRSSVAVIDGLRLAALVGLCVQAAFAVAMVSHRAHDGRLFYAPSNAWSTGALDVLAAAWVVAFVLVVADRSRLAIIPAVLASTWSVILVVSNFVGNLDGAVTSVILLGVEITLLGVVPTLALLVASTRRSRTSGRPSVLWLAALVGLTALFSVLHTGIGTSRNGGRQLSWPSSGGLVSFLSWVCLAALLAMLLASLFDPRFGVAVIVVALPIIVYQVGLLVTVDSKPAWPVVVAISAFATTAAIAVSTAISLRHLRLD
ncbi:MAG: hypothetical protein QOF20_572 [Acidimicrobiaceae bacterium]|jgi:hypothetical protein|nr:hypothetical protein [Acidimicrobiaceae bacterium]MDQ1364700.1 hypothetical protein [Acidimicrobiaceae bacterium]MDQ1368219.1 hypothetical protein [Acidimicrobiaceae bacterium]MDQ1378864.1 hypothetical protein [Acidimicrobiaceae bacterium]MDQ1399505.1 hypothetical protein [Acidimicrobiaceae bacterium]